MDDLSTQSVGAAEERENLISVDEQEEPFKRLPDDIIVSHIFARICEAKSLCICSMVSKHFSSLVYQTHIVSFKIPRQKPSRQHLIDDPVAQIRPLSFPTQVFHLVTAPLRLVCGLFRSILRRSRGQSTRPFDIHFAAQVTDKFLTKFTSIKSLHIEFDYSGDLKRNSGLVAKWKMDSKSSSFIMLTARSLELAATDDDDNINPREVELLGEYFDCNMEIADSRFSLVEMLVAVLPSSLENVVVTDSKKQGKIDLGGIDIVQLRNGHSNMGDGEVNIRLWHEPFLKLPLSGCVMKIVTLLLCKDNKESGYDDFLIVKEAFDGEEDQVYVEAVMEMLKKDVASQKILGAHDILI